MKITIRRAKKTEIKRILEIQKMAFIVQAEKYDAYDIPPMIETERDVENIFRSQIILVAFADGILVGSIRITEGENDAELKRLSVAGQYQNMGIGKSLLLEAEKYCSRFDRIWLFTGGQSTKNIGLYKKAGYSPYKEEPFKDGFTLIFMEKFTKNHK